MRVDDARQLAERELAEALPRRWRHVQSVGELATHLGVSLGPDADVVAAAAWLHDIGYAPTVVETGFHPLDGARFLRRLGVDERIVGLVAHHSCAETEADERGLGPELAEEFRHEETATADLLWFCDMTTGPDGQRMTVPDRLAEIQQRYDEADPVHRFIVRAEPVILAVCARAEERLRLSSYQQSGISGARAMSHDPARRRIDYRTSAGERERS